MSIPYDPGPALTCRRIRELDTLAIEQLGIPGVVLMENAGRAIAEFIYEALAAPVRDRVVLLCGPGNNGGDGFVVARHLHNAGANVTIVLAAPPTKSHGDAAVNLGIVQRLRVPLLPAYEPAGLEAARNALASASVIVDALLGTGSTGSPRGTMAALIEVANAADARRIAIDLPSGLDADSGEVCEPCFRATMTVTLAAAKVGFAAPAARAILGQVLVAGIGAPPPTFFAPAPLDS